MKDVLDWAWIKRQGYILIQDLKSRFSCELFHVFPAAGKKVVGAHDVMALGE